MIVLDLKKKGTLFRCACNQKPRAPIALLEILVRDRSFAQNVEFQKSWGLSLLSLFESRKRG